MAASARRKPSRRGHHQVAAGAALQLVLRAVALFGAWRSAVATLLSDAIDGTQKAPLSRQRCLKTARRELNLPVLPPECHDDILEFYCEKVRDVTSRRYREGLEGGCNTSRTEIDSVPVDMVHVTYSPPKLGYVILMHRSTENVKSLIWRLYEPELTAFAVHVDTKSAAAFEDLTAWRSQEGMEGAVEVLSERNVVRGGSGMLGAELAGIRALLRSQVKWEYCILLSEQDYPLRANQVLFQWLWVHRGVNFISVDEGECERDVSFQCGDKVVSLSGGAQYPKLPGVRYGSGSQWFAITRSLAAAVTSATGDAASTSALGAIFKDLSGVKQPDESFFQAAVLNTKFCEEHIDYTLHWTDKDSMKEVRSITSEFTILSPGVLGSAADYAKLTEVRQQSLWAFFARKFDESRESMQLKSRLDFAAGESGKPRWIPVRVPNINRLAEIFVSSLRSVEEVSRLARNHDGLLSLQTLRVRLRPLPGEKAGGSSTVLYLRERLAMPARAHSALALRIGCDLNRTELDFEGDTSAVAAAATGAYACGSLWALVYWRMSRRPVHRDLVLVWVDPMGTPMQHAPISITEHSVLLWHRYTATLPLPRGLWTLRTRCEAIRHYTYV
eukprot:TRINITY_DN15468_c0_g1_i3.p1 TRINITY_DN15468_c0_g1~~TRINITY_DN15468_c0_g1_i3.p1  ORF type:complete len:614 (-),score=112.39 TRINITY_DN15468_c0_g1_i3:137-1978(-)